MLPIIKSIRPGSPIHEVSLSYLQFTSNHTQLFFEHAEIDILNIDECLFTMLPSDVNVPVINISPKNNISLNIRDSIIQAHETTTEVKIIPDKINSVVLIANTSIWVETVTLEKIENLEVRGCLIYSPHFNILNSNFFLSNNLLYYGGINIDSYALASIFDNRFINVNIKVLSDCIENYDLCANTFVGSGNIFDNSTIHFVKEKNNPQSTRLSNLVHNTFTKIPDRYTVISEQIYHTVNVSKNFWGDSSGPEICSNPGGEGASITKMLDYSTWCTNKNCSKYVSYPPLLDSTITTNCNSYKGGTIASIVIFSLLFVAIFAVGIFVYHRFCSSEKSTEEETIKHNIKVFSMLCAILSFLFIWFPIVAKGISNSCQTRVPAMTCVITTTDSSLASLMLLVWMFTIISNLALMYVSTNHLIHRGSIYFSIFLSKLLVVTVPFVIIIDIMVMIDRYLSSKVMIFAIICFIMTIITEIFLLIKIYYLRKSVTTFTVLVNDEEVSIQRSLLYSQGNVLSEQDEVLVSDGIFILSYDDYQKRTQKNLLFEGIVLGILFFLLIWFTVKFKVIGAFSFINIIGNFIRVAYGFYVVRTTKSYAQYDLYFIISLGLTATTSVLVVTYLFMVLYNPASNVSAYFVLTASYAYLILSLLSIEKTTSFKRSVAAQLNRENNPEVSQENAPQDTYEASPQYQNQENVVLEHENPSQDQPPQDNEYQEIA